jgi:NADH:ubiquinone oxidoreductase subunit E
MLKIKVCVGSSCYLKGAQKIIDYLENAVKERELFSRVELSGAFCLENCGDGIAISINDEIFHVATPEEAEQKIEELISGK